MRGFEWTVATQALYTQVVRDLVPRVQVVWGTDDPAVKLSAYGEQARSATGLDAIHAVPAKHFSQEHQAPAIADRIAGLAASANHDR